MKENILKLVKQEDGNTYVGKIVLDQEYENISINILQDENTLEIVAKARKLFPKYDVIMPEVLDFIVDKKLETISIASIQKKFRIGFCRTARIIDDLEDLNVISGTMGSRPRKVIMSIKDIKKIKKKVEKEINK